MCPLNYHIHNFADGGFVVNFEDQIGRFAVFEGVDGCGSRQRCITLKDGNTRKFSWCRWECFEVPR